MNSVEQANRHLGTSNNSGFSSDLRRVATVSFALDLTWLRCVCAPWRAWGALRAHSLTMYVLREMRNGAEQQ